MGTVIIKVILTIIVVISYIYFALYVILETYASFVGNSKAKQFLKKIKFPLSYKWTQIMAIVSACIIGLHILLSGGLPLPF